ncbi:hypothetical protein BT69DRAFT_685705 [Atractiella rhizophila]|nr:hypothetical protein BT69DRAFT_685705 [Atractiella rhizophila]
MKCTAFWKSNNRLLSGLNRMEDVVELGFGNSRRHFVWKRRIWPKLKTLSDLSIFLGTTPVLITKLDPPRIPCRWRFFCNLESLVVVGSLNRTYLNSSLLQKYCRWRRSLVFGGVIPKTLTVFNYLRNSRLRNVDRFSLTINCSR